MNPQQILKEINSQAGRILVREATQKVRLEIFEPAVYQMQDDFANHPITKEIEDGPEAENISNTIIGVRGENANLFSFIGFENGSDPIYPVYEILNEGNPSGPKMKYIRGSQEDNLVFDFVFTAPDKEAIFDATPMPWAEGISWADRIEKGIPGVKSFISKLGKGRSGGGIQSKNSLKNSATFRNTSYITEILKDFIENIKGSNNNV